MTKSIDEQLESIKIQVKDDLKKEFNTKIDLTFTKVKQELHSDLSTSLLTQLKETENKINANNLALQKVEKKQTEDTWASVVNKKKLTNNQKEIINTITNSIKENELREKNIEIIGLPEPIGDTFSEKQKNDRTLLHKLFDSIGIDKSKLVHHKRFKPHINKPSFLIITLPNVYDKFEVLKATRQLRSNAEYTNVYFNLDQTAAQRYQSKLLRDQRKKLNDERTENDKKNFIYIIKGIKIIKKPITSNQTY